MSNTLFLEVQRFGKWIKWLLIALILWTLFQIWASYTEDASISGWKLWEPFFVPIILFGFYLLLKLETKITELGILVQFKPFHFKPKVYSWDEISKVEVRTYRPIMEYGGWGLKYGWGGQGLSYTVSGTTGLQLHLKNGKKILIGTQREAELTHILTQLNKI